MPRRLLLAAALLVSACSSSREPTPEPVRGPGYTITDDGDGSVTISVDPTQERALAEALTAAAARLEWEPPERAGGLVLQTRTDLGANGTAYRYGYGRGRFDVYVYRHPDGVEGQLDETERALAALVEQGRIDAFEAVGRSESPVPWRGREATLHKVVFEETIGGEPWDSLMYLLDDGGGRWVKARVSHPRAARPTPDPDAAVRALLAAD